MKKPYEVALVVELGTVHELVLGPFGGIQDSPEDGGFDSVQDDED